MIRSSTGITLMEMLVTLAVSGILFGLAIPVTGNLISENRVSGQVNNLRGALALTRSEAVTRQQDVVICKSADQSSCTQSGEWEQGYIVFVDENRDRERNNNEKILHTHEQLPDNILLNYRAFGSRHYLVYESSGLTMTNGTFTICNQTVPERSRALIVTKTGRVRLSESRADGSALDCKSAG